MTTLVDPIGFFEEAFERILTRALDGVPPHAFVGIGMNWSERDREMYLPFVKRSKFNIAAFLEILEGALQSNDTLSFTDPISIAITYVDPPRGNGKGRRDNRLGGPGNRTEPDFEEWLKRKRSIIRVNNGDHTCLGRALCVAIFHLFYTDHLVPQWLYDKVRRTSSRQLRIALDLYKAAGVSELHACGIPEVEKFQKALPQYTIVVRSKEAFGAVIYKGPPGRRVLNLLFYSAHFCVITKLPGFLACARFCTICERGYSNEETHKCTNPCHCCKKSGCKITDWKYCTDCRRYFKSAMCYDKHLRGKGRMNHGVGSDGTETSTFVGTSTCDTVKRCKRCEVNYNPNEGVHTCFYSHCRTCKTTRKDGHYCYMPPLPRDEWKGNSDGVRSVDHQAMSKAHLSRAATINGKYSLIFYDTETVADTPYIVRRGGAKDDAFLHKVNYVVARRICNACCKAHRVDDDCKACARKIFEGFEALNGFCHWLMKQDGGIACAHFGSGFDNILLLDEIVTKMSIRPKNVIFRGQKLMTANIPCGQFGVKLIDSFCLVPTALSSFPKMFDLKDQCKPFFPYAFNTIQNWNNAYDGPFPGKEFYEPDQMKADQRQSFLQWYEENAPGRRFNLRNELHSYCVSDVDILTLGMMKFRKMVWEYERVDVLRETISIGAVSMRIYRQNYLTPDTIALIPQGGYSLRDKQSPEALLWMKYWSHRHGGLHVEHSQNGREFTIGKYKVDGFHRPSNTVLEYSGCFVHSHSRCYKMTDLNPLTRKVRKTEFEEHRNRMAYIRSRGFRVVHKWSCEFVQMMSEDHAVRDFMMENDLSPPLDPRQAFFGGRTCPYVLNYDVKGTENLLLLDINSLYPAVNKSDPYFVGHPRVLTDGLGEDISEYTGLLKVRVLPPRRLHLPLLPVKINGKLMFPLCRLCAEEMRQTRPCDHTCAERSLTGTYTSYELKKAVELGYEILRIYEVWQYDRVVQENPESGEKGLFTDFI